MIRTAVVVSLLAPLACVDSGAPPPSAATVTDSAGIRIVTTPPGDLVYAELAAEPTLSIGQLSGPDELLFGRIQSVRRDAAGNLVVADVQAHQIRIFDPQGRHLQSVGREGEGPGEFESLQGAWPVSDGGIVAADILLDRITQFDAEGTPDATATLAGSEDISFSTIGLAGPGMLLSRAAAPYVFSPESLSGSTKDVMDAMVGGEENRRLLFVRHRFDGTMVDTVATGTDALRASVSRGSGIEMEVTSFTVPFSPRSVAAGSAHGVVVTDGAAYGVRVFGEDGSLRLIARIDDPRAIRTDAHLEKYVRGYRSDSDEREIQEDIERYRQSPLPDSLPGYTDLLFAEGGEVWARRYRFEDASVARWDVFAADGFYLGRVDVPASFRIEEVGRGQALGVATDELGVERVQLYGLAGLGS
ncbi:MAG: 6-bladed beta-propeller [Gemmatimonadota bacterium]|nr:6-bladed beta-propeller [Gemmatimonadota bacterium]